MAFNHKDLLGIKDLSKEEILSILDTAKSFKEISKRPIKKVPSLRGRTIINLFFEPSTRTRTSFEIAAKRLSADAINISASTSSVSKGETLLDTARNLEAMCPDVIVMRHSSSGAPHQLARICKTSIVNAGDGAHEHPTQALLDALTILDHKKAIEGLEIAIIGDITHSRVARSNLHLLAKLGANLRISGPPTLLPPAFERLAEGYSGSVMVTPSIEKALRNADVVMMLRVQLERQASAYFPSLKEYSYFYGLNKKRLELAKSDVIVMHPGPVNRGIEIASDIVDGNYSLILDQVTNGVAVRMAVLYLITGGSSANAQKEVLER
ncbi:MAG: aspartate carbamoyltransferase catalytic subunit [Acidobacteria bacterium]|nr:aspartate carbamoyltransferase catalytic subunit [Acidobacteriota bacterium]